MIKDTKDVEKTKNNDSTAASLHSKEIEENLDGVNMEAWFYIYENYVNPSPKKSND